MDFFHAVKAPKKLTPECYWFIFFNNELLVQLKDDIFVIPKLKDYSLLEIVPVRIQYLGRFNGLDSFSAELSSNTPPDKNFQFKHLRSLLGILDDDSFYIASKAFQVVSWDANHQFCGKCGGKMDAKEDERVKICPKCNISNYPRISPAVIVSVINDGKILLANAKRFKSNFYSVLAGFVEAGESFEESIRREIREEVNIEIKNIKYFGSQPWPFPDSLMAAFQAEYASGELKPDGNEILDAQWFLPKDIPQIPGKWSIAGKMINAFIEANKK